MFLCNYEFIVEFMIQKWGIKRAQTCVYIGSARKEWQKYFTNLKHAGISYHIAQLRDLKNAAYEEEDCRLVFDIAREEARLMGVCPVERLEVNERKH